MKDKKILVSIVIPYFRKKSFILKTLNSIKKQTYKYYEIIIVYDDDNLEEFKFLQKQAFKEKKIKIYRNRSNFGVSYSRNLGVKKAKGDFIAFIDADDLWHRKKLQRQLNFMINKKLLISHTNYKLIDENGNIIGLMKISKNTSYNNLLKSCDIGLSTVMVSKKIKKYIKFPKIKTKEDFVLWLRLSKKFKIKGIGESQKNHYRRLYFKNLMMLF